MARRRKDDSAGVVWMAALVAVLVIAQQIASKAVRDGLFLTEFEVTALPYAVVGGAAISFVAAIALGRLMSSFSPAIAVPLIFGANALLFFGEAALASESPRFVAATLYLHTAAFGGAVVSGFWSVINERFDPYTARKVMGRIAGGATVGGMLGGALTWLFADLPIVSLLICLGVANVIGGGAILRVGAAKHNADEARQPAPVFEGFRVLAKHLYPRSLAMLVFLVALATATVDYVFKAGVTETVDQAELVGFFAMFYTGTGIVTFIVQAIGSRRALKALGVVPTVAVFPVVAFILLVVTLIFPGIGTLIALRGSAMVVENSLYRSGYELLYTAVPKVQKRTAKILIDLGSDRIGTAFASGLALVVIAAAADHADQLLLVAAGAFVLTIFGVLVIVRREYVGSLARQIRTSLRPMGEPTETASLTALASTFVGGGAELAWASDEERASSSVGATTSASRSEILAEVNSAAEAKRSGEHATQPPRRSESTEVSERLLNTPLRTALRSATAEGSEGTTWSELGRTAPGAVGQLTDILLSSREATDVRVLAAELLSGVPGQRTVAGLVQGLSQPDFRVRRAAALALLRICRSTPNLRPRMKMLVHHARGELRRPARPRSAESEFELSSPFRTDARGNTLAPSLELAFILLAIGGEADELRLAVSAVTSTNAAQRGTGLEYLDNLLPGDLRSRILALAEAPEETQAAHNVSPEVVVGLAKEFRAGKLTLVELRARYRTARQDAYERLEGKPS